MTALIVILCVILLVYIINFTLFFRVKGKADLFDNDGNFVVKLFFITLTKGKLHLGQDDDEFNSLIIERKGEKKTGVHLNADKEDKQSIVSHMNAPLFRNVLIRDIEVNFRIGKSNDAFFTTMSIVGIKTVYNTVISILKSRQSFSHRSKFVPAFSEDKLEVEFRSIISISIADIIYSFIRYKLECRGDKCGHTALGKRQAKSKR